MQLPRPFDGFVEHTKRVSPTCLVHFERNRYSVPASYANRPVSLRVYADRLVVVAEGQVLCEHARIIHRRHDALGQTVYDWRHYLAVLQRKPGALAQRRAVHGTARRLQAAAELAAQASRRRPRDGRDPGPGAAPRRAGRARRGGTGARSRRADQDPCAQRAAPAAGRHARPDAGECAAGLAAGHRAAGRRAALRLIARAGRPRPRTGSCAMRSEARIDSP